MMRTKAKYAPNGFPIIFFKLFSRIISQTAYFFIEAAYIIFTAANLFRRLVEYGPNDFRKYFPKYILQYIFHASAEINPHTNSKISPQNQ